MEPVLLARRLREATVVVVGDLVADEYVYGETDRVSREAPVPIVRWETTERKLGGAANVAANVAALGAKVRPVGVLGGDAAGSELFELFEAAGAETRGLVRLRDRHTETKTRILAGGRSTTRQQLLRLDRADDRPLSKEARARIFEALTEAREGADAIVVSDYGGGLIDDALAEELRSLARRMPVCVDSRYELARYRRVTVVKPNEPELEAAAGKALRTEEDVEEAGHRLRESLEAKALLVTRGRLGMNLFRPPRRLDRIPVWGPAEAVDVTGAGDTVLATLACCLAVDADLLDAARLANVAGGIVVQKPGTATCGADELHRALGQPVLTEGSP